MLSNDYRLTNTSMVVKGNLEGILNATTISINSYQSNVQPFLT
jgi:hypothetical protein